jgi:hypothetical protein
MTKNKDEDLNMIYDLLVEVIKAKLQNHPDQIKASEIAQAVQFVRMYDRSLKRDEEALANIEDKAAKNELIKEIVAKARKKKHDA